MNNPLKILQTLDQSLSHPVELVIYGRGALALGFPDPPPEVQATSDVDGIIPMSQLGSLIEDEAFWDAVEATNEHLSASGLYMTHLFQEDQVILTPDWKSNTVKLSLPLTNLVVSRPSTIDLILTKTMRGNDPQDMEDVRFYISADNISPEQLEGAFSRAIVPDIPELRDAFSLARPAVIKMAQELWKGSEIVPSP